MTAPRLKKWEKPVHLSPMFTGDNRQRLEQISSLSKKSGHEQSGGKNRPSVVDFISACRELIFDIKNDKPIFHLIAYTFDVDRMSIIIQPMFEMLVGEAGDEAQVSEEIENTLALVL